MGPCQPPRSRGNSLKSSEEFIGSRGKMAGLTTEIIRPKRDCFSTPKPGEQHQWIFLGGPGRGGLQIRSTSHDTPCDPS